MNSKSFIINNLTQLENEINRVKTHFFKPTLAIVFGSITCELDKLPAIFSNHNIDLVGCSSSGEICNEGIDDKSISVLLMDLEKDCYTIQVFDEASKDSLEVGKNAGKKGNIFCKNPAYLTFFGMHAVADDIIDGIVNQVGKKTKIFGGMAGDDFNMVQTYTFTSEGIYKDSAVFLILDEAKVEVHGKALCGWESIGTINTITHAENNIVYTINDKPALEVFENYFGSFHENDGEVIDAGVGVAQYPLQIIREDTKVLRAALKVNEEDQSLMLAGPVKTGDQFKFSVAPGFGIIEDTIEGFQEYHKNYASTDAMILVSCKARHMSLGPIVEEEVKGIQNIWNKPLVGFFSYGEVGLTEDGDCYYYNETCSLVLIKER